MPDTDRDTIFAPATGQTQSAISIIRISGPRAHAVLSDLIDGDLPEMRRLSRRSLIGSDSAVIDDGMVVCFADGASFTGEDMAEIHCHGSRAVLAAVSENLRELGCRMAYPGEFSRRAFERGRLDLAEATGLSDLIAAETELQRKQAMRIYSGALSAVVEDWRHRLLRACALLEVSIDWVDEDVPEDVLPEVHEILTALCDEVSGELRKSKASQRLRSGFEVAIIGPPNVGKSTLLNCLAGREAAIVSNVPGTTRDVIEVRYDLEGLPVTFLDTAGLRETVDEVEIAGIKLAEKRARDADLRLILSSVDGHCDPINNALFQAGDIHVWSKSDLAVSPNGVSISAKTGDGIAALIEQISLSLKADLGDIGLVAHLRHEESLRAFVLVVREVLDQLSTMDFEISSEHLRMGARQLESIVGRIDTEAVLDSVFSSFCLGK